CGRGDPEAAARALETLARALPREHPGLAIVRLNQAHVARALGRTEAARAFEAQPAPAAGELPGAESRLLKRLRRCAAVRPRQGAGVVAPFAENLAAAERLAAAGRYAEARETAARADAQATEAGRAGAERIRAAQTLALVELQLGRPDAAMDAARRAIQIAREDGAVGPRITLARLLAQTGDLEAAHRALREVEPELATPLLRAEWQEAAGDLALRVGSPRQAVTQLEAALAGHRAHFGPAHPSTAAVLHRRGDALRQARELRAATAAYGEALAIRQEKLGVGHPETARVQNALGVLHADFGDWERADAAFAAAEASLVASLGGAHPETLTLRTNRSLAAWAAHRRATAVDAYAAALAALTTALGAGHPVVAEGVRTLARLEQERGRGERAEALLARALASQRIALGDAHPALAPTHLARSRLLLHRGKPDAAAAELVAALELLTRHYDSGHPLLARTHMAAARTAVARAREGEAWTHAREAARGLTEHLRRAFGALSDRQRSLLADDSADVVGVLLSVGTAPTREVYTAVLPHRDSVLRSIAASRAGARAGSGRSRDALARLRDLRARYVATAFSDSPDLAAKAARLAAEIDSLETLAALSGSSDRGRDPLEVLQAACSNIPADAVAIEFLAYDRTLPGSAGEPVPSYLALLIRPAGCSVQRVELGAAAPIEAAADRFGRAMRDQASDAVAARRELAELLLAPLQPVLGDTRRWLVVPDGPLWGVPFGALPDPQAPEAYLLERVTLGYWTSLYELAEAVGTPQRPGFERALLFGAPEFGSGDGALVLTASGPCALPPFEPLPATERELSELSALLGSDRVVRGAEATKAGLQQALAARPPIVHLATHAYFAGLGGCETQATSAWSDGGRRSAANPLLLSGIVLAGANASTSQVVAEDVPGILTAFEVAGLDLSGSQLVVMSACDTGTGLHQRGQEVQGLRWGLRAAGARALVTSLWRSNDAATRVLMRAFYTALRADDLPGDLLGGAEALRRAQLERVARERRLGVRKPLHWANFVFSGAY
ncbi:MAG: CHAT domain-containing protein, partial [Proteobacteria bacterium]|nr:CHAT domain-containing protein [Pseudomonadota bacterium]